jgi:hypothetical protein
MPLTIPTSSVYVIKQGSTGIPAWSVQRVLNKLGYPTGEDASFGPQTEGNVKKLQTRIGVTADGIVGPTTQRKLAELLCARQEKNNDLPDKLLLSKITYESAGLLAAVNWSVAGGVDCGVTQRRVYTTDYDDEGVIKRAFDAVYQIDLSGDRVRELFDIFRQRPAVTSRELALRLAILNHNYPYAADQISRKGISGLSSYWRTPQDWVKVHGLRFPDGVAIVTPLQWSERYALGNSEHREPGQSVRYVSNWE